MVLSKNEASQATEKLLQQQCPTLAAPPRIWNSLERVMPLFKEMCLKSQAHAAYRNAWCVDQEKRDPDLGLIFRDGSINGKEFDHKFFFHYSLGMESSIPKQHIGHLEHTVLDTLWNVYRIIDEMAVALYQAIDVETRFQFALEEKYRALPDLKRLRIRLLFYQPKSKTFAKKHFDRDGLTFHLWESKPALEYGKNKQFFQAKPNQVLVMPGIKAAILTDSTFASEGLAGCQKDNWQPNGVLQPTPHRAVRPADDTEERYSAVAFSHLQIPSHTGGEQIFSKLQKQLIQRVW